jgi:hypothetical protein
VTDAESSRGHSFLGNAAMDDEVDDVRDVTAYGT